MSRKAFTATVVAATIAWSIGLASLLAPLTARAAVTPGSLVKASLPAVYYVGADGKRYVFPNEKTYKTWYADFSTVTSITDAELAALQIGGNVTYRPGVKMVKITTDPKVYAVDKGGKLRWVTSESLAVALYGSTWNTMIDDVPDAFFTNYVVGADVNSTSDFSASTAQAGSTSINEDKSLTTLAGALSVAAALDNPASATIISDGTTAVAGSQAFIDMLKLKFTSASGTSAKVTQLKLTRTGVSADSDVDNVYLFDGNTMLAEMASLSSGVVTFSGSPLFTVAGEKTVTVKLDLNRDSTAGKTLGLKLAASSDVQIEGGAGVSGTPVDGNLMTVAAVSDFGRLQLAAVATAATVDPGATDFEAMRFTLQASNQDVKISKLRMKMLGSINTSDLADMKLMDGATQVGPTQASLDADKYVNFDLSSSPLKITNGVTKTLSLKVNVKGGATRTIQFSFQKPVDLMAMDGNYNVGLKPDTGTIGIFAVTNSTQATVNSGSLTVTLNTASPTGNVALNATNILLAKYDLKAVGEAIKVSSVDFQASSDSFAGATNWTNLRNMRLMYNGVQVGTTQTTVAEDTNTSVTVNFTVAAGATGVLEIRSDIAAASGAANAVANGETIHVRLNAGTNNAQRQDSLGTINVPSANTNGNNLTVAAGALTVAINSAFGAQTVVQSTSGVKLGSWLLTAGSSEGLDVTSIVLDEADGADGGATTNSLGTSFTNLKLKKSDGTQLGATVIPNTADADGTDYTFSLSPALSLDGSQTVEVNLYGDVLSNANANWEDADTTRMVSSTGTGKVTSSSVSGTANVVGQAVTVQTAGQLSLATDSSSPIATQLVMGATGATLGIWKFSANNVEDITVSQIIVNNENAGGSANVKNLQLYVGGVPVGQVVPAFDGSNNATFANLSVLVPRAGDKLVTLKGDMVPFTDGAAAGVFTTASMDLPATITGVGTDTVIARGASGQFATTPAATDADANNQYSYRTTLTTSIACSGSCTSRPRSSSDIIGKLSLTGTSNGDAQFRPAMQVNDDSDGGAAGNNWQVVAGTNANAAAADAAVSVDGISVNWTATAVDWDVDDLLVFDLPATADLSTFSRVSFWLWTTSATAGGNDFAFFTSDTATTTGSQQTAVTTTTAATAWTYVDIAMPAGTVAADDFAGLRMLTTDLAVTDEVKVDEVRFYNDSITLDVTGNLCDTDANCVAEDGAGTINNPTGLPVTLRNSGGSTVGVGYYTGSATTGTVQLLLGADVGAPAGAQTASNLTPSAGLLSLGGSAQVFDLVANTNELTDVETAAVDTNLSVSLDLGTATTAGDFRWWDQAVTGTSPVTWMNGSSPVTVSMTY